jgi:hypothetical protein
MLVACRLAVYPLAHYAGCADKVRKFWKGAFGARPRLEGPPTTFESVARETDSLGRRVRVLATPACGHRPTGPPLTEPSFGEPRWRRSAHNQRQHPVTREGSPCPPGSATRLSHNAALIASPHL